MHYNVVIVVSLYLQTSAVRIYMWWLQKIEPTLSK